MSDDENLDKEVSAWLNAKRMDDTARYAQAGRRLRDISDDDLSALWKKAMGDWANAPSAAPAVIDEILAEAELRGMKPPAVEANPEAWAKLLAAIMKGKDELLADPAKLEQFEDGIRDDMDKLFDRAKKPDA